MTEVIHVTEFMHPRVEEICGTMPARLGRCDRGAAEALPRRIDRMFNSGRHVRTDGIFWFMALYSLAGMRRFRRSLLRHEVEDSAHRGVARRGSPWRWLRTTISASRSSGAAG